MKLADTFKSDKIYTHIVVAYKLCRMQLRKEKKLKRKPIINEIAILYGMKKYDL